MELVHYVGFNCRSLCSKLVERMLTQERELSSMEAATLTAAAGANTTAATGSSITLKNCDPPRPQDRGGCCAAN